MGDRVWQVPKDRFIAAWNAAGSVDEAAAAVRALAGGPAPRWAVMARATALRREGYELKPLSSPGAAA